MALNQFYPYQYQTPYQQNYQQGFQQNNQIQNNGFVPVHSLEEAYNYPVAPGNSITFKNETEPFMYTKTKGISPLEQPVFEMFKLVKVDYQHMPQSNAKTSEMSFDAESQIKLLWDEINALKGKIKGVQDAQSADDSSVQAVHE